MGRLLYIQASPRGERSKSMAVAQTFAEAYLNANPGDEIETINLFTKKLPAFDGPALSAKYNILRGEDATPEEKAAWDEQAPQLRPRREPDGDRLVRRDALLCLR